MIVSVVERVGVRVTLDKVYAIIVAVGLEGRLFVPLLRTKLRVYSLASLGFVTLII